MILYPLLDLLFVPILKQFAINEYTVKDCFLFGKEIIDQDPNLFMASFDIQSLFTSIPLAETINACVDFVFYKKKKVKGATQPYQKIIFESASTIGENTTNILNCYFSS